MFAGAHLCALCSEPAERNKLNLAFRQEGQRQGDAYLRLTDHPEHGPWRLPETRRWSTRGYPRSDVRPASAVCLRDGQFSAERMTAVLVDRAVRGAEAGSPLLRVMVEMGWLPERAEMSDVLGLYETAVDHVVDQVSAVVLCVYELHRLDAEMLTSVLAAHPTVFLDATVLVNPHSRSAAARYVPTEGQGWQPGGGRPQRIGGTR